MFKSQGLFSIFFKLLVSIGAIYYLVHQVDIPSVLFILSKTDIYLLGILLIFTSINWFLETKKWQYLASQSYPIDWLEAARQSLVSFSLSMLTPNRVGEYGAKVLFYPKEKRKQIFSLSLIGNMSQMFVSLGLGLLALVALLFTDDFKLKQYLLNYWNQLPPNQRWLTLGLILSLIMVLVWLFWRFNSKKIMLTNPKIWSKAFIYALLRYLVFSLQFLFLLWINVVPAPLYQLYLAVVLTYFFATLVPMLAFLDWAVKSSIAVIIFGILGAKKEFIMYIVGLMWLLNFALPFVIGLFWMWLQKKRL